MQFIRIANDFVNLDRIIKISQRVTDSDGYTHKRTYHLFLYFAEEEFSSYKTYNFEEHKQWCEALGIEELLTNETKRTRVSHYEIHNY